MSLLGEQVMKVEVGRVCEKGNHIALEAEDDFGACGSHYWATVYITVEKDRDGRDGDEIDAEALLEHLERLVKADEAHRWCGHEGGSSNVVQN